VRSLIVLEPHQIPRHTIRINEFQSRNLLYAFEACHQVLLSLQFPNSVGLDALINILDAKHKQILIPFEFTQAKAVLYFHGLVLNKMIEIFELHDLYLFII